MNAVSMARDGYSRRHQPVRTARDNEYDIFTRVTRRLRIAADGSLGFAALAEAMDDNRRLWSALSADATGDGNGLPPALRGRIVYLAEFSRLHSLKVLDGLATADVLIDINTAVMRGLRPESGRAT